MTSYFSFQKLITTSIVKAIYALGFVVLTVGGIALIVWAALRLNDANISRELGWRYVAVGAAALLLGNLAWRVICEFWIVLFNINHHLASIDYVTNLNKLHRIGEVQFVERRVTRDRRVANSKIEIPASPKREVLPVREKFKAERPAGVLGLS